MTEAEWLASDDVWAMVRDVAPRTTDRKFRLFGVACCRLLGRVPANPEFIEALEAAEEFVDRKANKAALRRARQAVRSVRPQSWGGRKSAECWAALRLAELAATEKMSWTVLGELDEFVTRDLIPEKSRPPGPALARCLFGNLYGAPKLGVGEKSSNVLELARAVYDDRAFERLPILADALEESGCVDAGILAHCREDSVHARGCWVLDLILGKS
jgi:hypothetical protein